MIKQILALLGIATASSCAPYTPSQDLPEVSRPDTPFRLIVLGDYGAKPIVDLPNPTEQDIIDWMDKLDWRNGFYMVDLHHDDDNFFDVSGSLNPRDGLSSMVRINGNDWVTPEPPKTVEEMKALIISYYRNDDLWKKVF